MCTQHGGSEHDHSCLCSLGPCDQSLLWRSPVWGHRDNGVDTALLLAYSSNLMAETLPIHNNSSSYIQSHWPGGDWGL
jgi:hypothetical protein